MAFRVVVLVSGSGTLLQALIDAHQTSRLPVDIVAVGSERLDALALDRARSAGIDTFVVPMPTLLPMGSEERLAWDAEFTRQVAHYQPDLVVLAGFMKLFDRPFMSRFGGRIINSHPSLLPDFPGAHAVRDALAAGVAGTGCSIFWVDEGVDTGRMIAQRPVPVLAVDDEATLHERIKIIEREMLVQVVTDLAMRSEDAPMPDRQPITRALVSVYDKTGLAELGEAFKQAAVQVVSTGKSYAVLAEAGVDVQEVADLTGFPECLDGRVKTLHPRVHAGILADRRLASHRDQLTELGIEAFDLVVSNLYPFSQTVASGATPDECVEQIDIGGPSMVRAAAKNHPSVAIVTSPGQYGGLVEALTKGGYTLAERQRLAAAAFVHTATYDAAVASWMGTVLTDSSDGDGFPGWLSASWTKVGTLRYGENSHQPAALYADETGRGGLTDAVQLHGKEMSYNNYQDGEAAYRAAYDFDEPCVAIIKHANPCGIATGATIAEAHAKAHACDPVSAFGGVIATNRPVSVEMAATVKDIFTEVIIAPGYEDGAVELLSTKKNVRILVAEPYAPRLFETRQVSGGLLVQKPDLLDAEGDEPAHWTQVCGNPVDEATMADLAFAWRAVRSVKSNAILLAADGASVGVGMGQVNRVDSCKLAVQRAGERASGSVAASDAFFPFSDGPQVLFDAGVRAIVQPGGSVRDKETIDAAQAAGVAMFFTGTRHFFH